MRLGAGEGRHLRHQPILLGSCNALTRKVTTQPGVRGVSESPCRARPKATAPRGESQARSNAAVA